MQFTEEQVNQKVKDAEEKKDKEFSEKINAKDEDLKKKDKEIMEFKESGRKKEVKNFCETLKKEGKLTPAEEKLGLTEFMEGLDNTETRDYGEGDGKKNQTPFEFMKSFLKQREKVVEFSEKGRGDGSDTLSGDEAKREKLIADYQETHKCEYKEAMLEISKIHPDLFKEE